MSPDLQSLSIAICDSIIPINDSALDPRLFSAAVELQCATIRQVPSLQSAHALLERLSRAHRSEFQIVLLRALATCHPGHLSDMDDIYQIAAYLNHLEVGIACQSVNLLSIISTASPQPCFSIVSTPVVNCLSMLDIANSKHLPPLLSQIRVILQEFPGVLIQSVSMLAQKLVSLVLQLSPHDESVSLAALCLADLCMKHAATLSDYQELLFKALKSCLRSTSKTTLLSSLHLLSRYAAQTATVSGLYGSFPWLPSALDHLLLTRCVPVREASLATLGCLGAVDPLSDVAVGGYYQKAVILLTNLLFGRLYVSKTSHLSPRFLHHVTPLASRRLPATGSSSC